MYSQYFYGQPSPDAGLSNNPFVADPNTAHARFPDLNAPTSNTEYPSQQQQYQPQYQLQSYGPGGPYQQTMAAPTQFTSTSYAQYQGSQPTGIGALQPSPGFPHQQHQSYPGYPYSGAGAAPPSNATPSYLAEFDPYLQSSQPSAHAQSSTHGGGGPAPPGVSHPRDLIRTHKAGLEAWEAYSWKQLLSACDMLKEAWAARKRQAESVVRQYAGSDPGLFGPDPAFGYNSQVEGWKQVLRDANDNSDTVAASTFQLHEVYNSYRQSGDQASKRRVRESCNAAVRGLPDWPSN